MDDLWFEFRMAPSAYLVKHRTNVEALVHELLQILYSDDKSDHLMLSVLGVFQECCNFLLDDLTRLEMVLGTLKNIFEHQRNTSDPVVSSQMLVTITVAIIRSDFFDNVQPFLIEFVTLLLDIIEKIKTESNRLLRATACECLKELELSIPGLLCVTVGHLYGMSLAENSFIHQHYMGLFATVLAHYIQKLALLYNDDSSPLPDNDRSLEDLLFYNNKLMYFEPPAKYLKMAQTLSLMPSDKHCSIPESKNQSELKKAVAHLVDHLHLFTPHYTVQIIIQLMKIIKSSSLAPVMLKSLLLRYSSSLNLQLFHAVLLVKLEFGDLICDERDEDMLNKRIMIIGGHPSLPSHHAALLVQWFTQINNCSWISFSPDISTQHDGSKQEYSPLLLHVFDTQELCWYKLQALSHVQRSDVSFGHRYLERYLAALQKPVLYGITGSTSQLFYRTMVMCSSHTDLRDEIQKAAVDVLIAHPQFTSQTVDMLDTIEKNTHERSMTVGILSQVCQWLLSLDVSALYAEMLNHLFLLETAAKSMLIKQQIPLQILHKIILESDVCQQGQWSTGNALLKVCYTLMQTKPDASVSKNLVNLLVEISKSYKEIDIRDRAKFYSQILLSVSSEKLSLLLCDNEEKNKDLSQVVVARISDNAYPLPASAKSVSDSILTITRLPCETDHKISMDSSFVPSTQSDLLLEYYRWLQEQKSNIGLKVPCDLSVSASKPDWISDRLYAIVLHLSTTGPYIKPKDAQIPALMTGESVKRLFTLYPLKPFPTSFKVSAIFTVEDGDTCTSSLNPLNISFDELFHIPPVDAKQVSLKDLFSKLWNEIESNQYSSDHPDREGALSVVRLQIDSSASQQLITENLAPFCVNKEEGTGSCLHDVLLFLPPHYHLLLKFSVSSDSTVVSMATDSWMLLPYIGDWINNLVS